MSDTEYAARIYCKVFHLDEADGDKYAQGILDEKNSMTGMKAR